MNAIAPNKETMIQYSNMQEEVKRMRADIRKTEDDIAKMLAEGTVQDKVKGGLGGIQGFKVEGFPITAFEKRKRILRHKVDRLIEKENELLEMIESIEIFIDNIPVSRDRRIFRGIYFEGKTQMEVAEEINISQAQVSRLEKKALRSMKNYLG